jgi:uncharacterized protein YraI
VREGRRGKMRDKILFIVLCGSLLLLPAGERAATGTQAGAGVVPCNVEAYVNDPDPRGLNVRSGPGNTYGVVGNLPNQNVEGVVVHVNGSKGEWLRIDRATEVGGDEDRVLFAGEGWVYGPLLGVDGVGWLEGGTPLYREPEKRGRVVTKIPADGEGPTTIRGCRGGWVYVEHRKLKGWAAPGTLCSNPLTNCS